MHNFKDYDYSLLDNYVFQVAGINIDQTRNREIACNTAYKDWCKEFGNSNPIHVEIGCGNGHFLVKKAAENPGINYIGIDLKKNRIIRCREKQEKRNLNNMRWICGEAYIALSTLFPAGSIDFVYMTFPDPWPKKRHHKKRLFQDILLNLLYNKLTQTGEFLFISDHEEYYESSVLIASADNRYLLKAGDFSGDLVESLFGKMWEKDKRKIQSFTIKKL